MSGAGVEFWTHGHVLDSSPSVAALAASLMVEVLGQSEHEVIALDIHEWPPQAQQWALGVMEKYVKDVHGRD